MRQLLVLTLILFSVSIGAQQTAVRQDGVTVILHPDGRWELAPPVPPPAPVVAPAVLPGAVRVFFGNLHSHTGYTDGSATPADAYAHARDDARIAFLAITEHNHSQAGTGQIARDHTLYNGSRADSLISTAARFNETGRFVAIYGQEFSSISSGNHANVLEVGEVIDEAQVPNGKWDNLLDTWLPAHPDSQGQPAILLLNHPDTSDSPNSKEYGRDDYPNDLPTWRAHQHPARTSFCGTLTLGSTSRPRPTRTITGRTGEMRHARARACGQACSVSPRFLQHCVRVVRTPRKMTTSSSSGS